LPEAIPLRAFWCRVPSRPNFGDALTPWLIRRVTGRYPSFVRPDDPRDKLLAVGSILEYAGPRSTVWGSGILTRGDRVDPAARLLAVRGPLSRARALECGAECPEVYGDPALLLPRFHQPPPVERRGVGVVAHYSDQPRLVGRWPETPELRLIDVQDPVEQVIDRIAACEVIASSSLHGLIVAHAYGVPALWVKFRNLIPDDDVKFHDYFASRGLPPPAAHRLADDHVDAEDVARRTPPPPPPIDLDPLWASCPFREAS
jgi:hypothetical protein